MVLLTLVIPFMGVAIAAHGGAGTAAIDVDQITLTPESASLPPGTNQAGTCVQFTASARDGGAVAEGETLDVIATMTDDDPPAGTTGEVADITLSFCDPDGTGTNATDLGGDSDLDDDGPEGEPATIHGECLTNANGDCIFGIQVQDQGTGGSAGGSGTVTAFADTQVENDEVDPQEPRDDSTITIGNPVVAGLTCSPAAQSRPEGGRAEFVCSATNSAGQALAGVLITGDVVSGPNAEEIGPAPQTPIQCTTGSTGSTPATNPNFSGQNDATATPLACAYNDPGANTVTSPPGTDNVVFCVQSAAPSGQPNTTGCDAHEVQAAATVSWVGPASHISCTPDGAQADPGSTVLVSCSVTDINNQPSPAGLVCSFTETGPGNVTPVDQGQGPGETNASGVCQANASTASNESGTQTITGALSGAGTNCTNGAPNTGPPAAPAGTTCSDTATINWQEDTPTPTTDCADGTDNDGDGEIDLNDRGCRSADDPTEAGPFASAITLRLRRARPRGFTGQVASSFSRCQNGRAVTILRRGRGVIGSDTTNRDGNYFVRFRGRRGRFQARVAPRTITTRSGDEILCQGDRSPVIGVRRRR
jgi:hypothetical protein